MNLSELGAALPEGEIDCRDGLDAALDARAEALARIATSEIETAFIAPDGFESTWVGVDGYREGWRDWLLTFDTYTAKIDALHEGDGALVLFTTQRGRPRSGGAMELDNEGAVVVFLSGERVKRLEFHLDRDRAMRAAGLTGE